MLLASFSNSCPEGVSFAKSAKQLNKAINEIYVLHGPWPPRLCAARPKGPGLIFTHIFGAFIVLVLNEMVLVLDVAGQSSTSTALRAEYEYEYENTRISRIARQKCGQS